MEGNEQYTGSSIRTIEGVEHIRLRPGMYIGRLGNGNNPGDGIYAAFKDMEYIKFIKDYLQI